MRTYPRASERTVDRDRRRTDPGGDQDASNLLLEDGNDILLEDGAFLLLDYYPPGPSLLLDFAKVGFLDPRITFARASSGTYFDQNGVLQTASAGVARFDHDPTTGEALGLLIEEQRTNLNTYSEDLSAVGWSLNNSATVTTNAGVAPDGTTTADQINGAALTGTGVFKFPAGASSGVAYTFSVFIKNVSAATALRIGCDANPSNATVVFNAQTGVIASVGANVTSSSVVNVGNGWYRVIVGFTTTSTAPGFVIYSNSGSVATWLAWGVQLEAGAFATSYIPTTTASVTRNADAASMTGTNFSSWFNNAEGTLFAEVIYNADTAGVVSYISNGSFSNLLSIARETTLDRFQIDYWSGGSRQALLNLTTNSALVGAIGKVTTAYKVNDFVGVANAGSPVTDTAGLIPAGPNRVSLGYVDVNGSSFLNGTIRKIAFYPQRLTNAQLQALTG